jgi:hypothetical protein
MLFFFGLPYSTNGQSNKSPFESYDCRFYMAEVEVPVEPVPQATLDALEFPVERITDWSQSIVAESEAWKKWSTAANFSFGLDRGDMAMINDLNSLHPYFRDKVSQLIQECKRKGITLAIVEAYRTPAKQHEYKSMGKKYTRSGAGRSKHQFGMAVDVVPIVDSVAQWDNKTIWKKVGIIGETLGLRWGGRWQSLYDPGHFEWTGGLTSVELNAGKLPIILNEKTLYPCLEEDLEMLRNFWQEWSTEQSIYARNENGIGSVVPPSH